MKKTMKTKELLLDCTKDTELYEFYLDQPAELRKALIMYKKTRERILNFKIDFGKTESELEGDPVLGGIMGICVADALGVPVEFRSREELKKDPVNGMRGYGTFNQPVGTWSDDSSMMLCLADSLSRGLDYGNVMQNFSKWLFHGKFTPHGESFDIGSGTYRAIMRYKEGEKPLLCGGKEESDNGNGSLMRILPLIFYLRAEYGSAFTENDEAMQIIDNVSSLTHAHKRSVIACGIYLSVASKLIDGDEVDDAVSTGFEKAMKYYRNKEMYVKELSHFNRIEEDGFNNLLEEDIKSSGYVVDTLEAALWCLLNTESYSECVLRAVNLGKDTDTVGSVAGGLVGIYYGYGNIPKEWIDVIAREEFIENLCEKLSLKNKVNRS